MIKDNNLSVPSVHTCFSFWNTNVGTDLIKEEDSSLPALVKSSLLFLSGSW